MFLKHCIRGDMIEVMDKSSLFDPFKTRLLGRFHAGEEMPEAEYFEKNELVFPSGEALPRCWVDGAYRQNEIRRVA